MGRRHYPSRTLPADTAPEVPETKPRGPDNLVDRLEAMVGNVRTTPLTQVRAALRLHREPDGRDLAEYFGLTDAYDGIARVREHEQEEQT